MALSIDPASATERKRVLRSRLITERARLSTEERASRSRLIAERAAALPYVAMARAVALYAPLGTEVDALELARLVGSLRTVYPRTVPGSRHMDFAHCSPRELVRAPLGTREPPPEAPAVDPKSIDCIVLPGIGFSLDGHRLGRGGGYYDTTLSQYPAARRVAIAFEVQLLAEVPHEGHDETLDAIVTESRAILFDRGSR